MLCRGVGLPYARPAHSVAGRRGSDPRDGTFRTPREGPPLRLDRRLKDFRPDASWGDLRDLVRRGKVSVDGELCRDPATLVGSDVEIAIAMARPRPGRQRPVPLLPAAAIVHCDGDVVVVHKPAGVDTVPYEGDDAASREASLDARVAVTIGGPVRVVHRLDRDTSGLLMFARTPEAMGRLMHQLRRHTVHRRYLALVHGAMSPRTIRSYLADDRGDGLRGSVPNGKLGKLAVTHVAVVERLRGASLVACRLETGRTHQIRIHLAEAGHMLLGERGYLREHQGPVLPAPRILLHAAELGFVHPGTGRPLHFAAEIPDDMARVIAALRN